MCCSTEDIHVKYKLNKTGFVPGESILVYAEVHNRGQTVTSARVAFKQVGSEVHCFVFSQDNSWFNKKVSRVVNMKFAMSGLGM